MRTASVVPLGSLVLCACGSSTVKTVQSNQNVQQVEQRVEQLVSNCLPTSDGTPDPLALRGGEARAKFAACTGWSRG